MYLRRNLFLQWLWVDCVWTGLEMWEVKESILTRTSQGQDNQGTPPDT
jgi:hypothetical protein